MKFKDCPYPNAIPFGMVQVRGKGQSAIAIYHCDKGYYGSGMVRKCTVYGEWDGREPECTKG